MRTIGLACALVLVLAAGCSEEGAPRQGGSGGQIGMGGGGAGAAGGESAATSSCEDECGPAGEIRCAVGTVQECSEDSDGCQHWVDTGARGVEVGGQCLACDRGTWPGSLDVFDDASLDMLAATPECRARCSSTARSHRLHRWPVWSALAILGFGVATSRLWEAWSRSRRSMEI
jgi:hypothetical protein